MQNKISPKTFGNALGFFRRECHDPLKGGRLSQERLAELISEEIRKPYSRNDISAWELDKTVIHPAKRDVLVCIISIFVRCGGIKTLGSANHLLELGNYRALNENEMWQISKWSHKELMREELSDKETRTLKEASPFPVERIKVLSPYQIPPLPPQGVLGREDAIVQLFTLLALDDESGHDIPPVALRGMGGIGKTTLAIALARLAQIPQRFPDGVLWTSLGPRPTIRLLLESWGRTLNVDLLPERDEKACCERLRGVLYSRRVLLVVDDVWESAQGSYFQIAGPYSRTLFTTREMPVAHDLVTRERTLCVDVLKPEAALALLRKLALEAVAADEKSAARLCEKLEFLPLGLTLAGRLLANDADVPSRTKRLVGELIERRESRLNMLQPEGRLGLKDDQPVSLQAILGMSVERLSQVDQDRFAMLSVFGGEPLTWDIAPVCAVWDCSLEDAETSLSHLIQRGLVERRVADAGNARYWMHALLADYAAELRDQKGL